VIVAQEWNRRIDPALKRLLEELRDLRVEARADRRQAEADGKRAAAERYAQLIRRSDERFQQTMREWGAASL